MNLTIEQLIKMLHSVTEYDIIDCGYDSDSHKCYAIRNLATKPSMLLLGNLEITDVSSDTSLLKYKNVLSTADFIKTNKGNIFVDSSNKPINLLRNDLIFSTNKLSFI